jgi:hypothetical protein
VAGRFGTTRTLIGPELYPFYMFGVKVLLVVAAVVTAIPLVISTVTDPGELGRRPGALPVRLHHHGHDDDRRRHGAGGRRSSAAGSRGAGFADWKVADLPAWTDLNPGKKGPSTRALSSGASRPCWR